jgi:hypothetical protein
MKFETPVGAPAFGGGPFLEPPPPLPRACVDSTRYIKPYSISRHFREVSQSAPQLGIVIDLGPG